MRRTITIMLSAGLVLGGQLVAPAAQAAPTAPAEFQPAPVAWGPCLSPGLRATGAECGLVEVPLDYDEPDSPRIGLAVSRVRHTGPDAQFQGVMLVNPGGPGGSGIEFARLGSLVPGDAGADYDWIGFDPRGVGSSEPALSCIPGYNSYGRPDYRPESGTEQAWLERVQGYAAACATAGGPLLDHLTTHDSVRDMDTIRKALGQEQISFYGFSYGTYLGQVYGTLFPDRVRRMVLDGVVDADDVWYRANLKQNVAFERNLQVFFDWVAKYDSVYGLGSSGEDVENLYYAEQDKLRTDPAAGLIGPAEWNDLFLAAGYNVQSWPAVAETFAAWAIRKDAVTLKASYDATASTASDNGYAVYLGVQCTDEQMPTDWARWQSDHTRLAATAPFATWGNAWFNAPCAFWSGQAQEPVEVDGSGVQSVLLLSETYDGATPFNGALTARRLFPAAVLIEGVGGSTHSASLSGIGCTDDRIAAYLVSGALPARQSGDGSDVQCDPLPQPDPTGGADQASTATGAAERLGAATVR